MANISKAEFLKLSPSAQQSCLHELKASGDIKTAEELQASLSGNQIDNQKVDKNSSVFGQNTPVGASTENPSNASRLNIGDAVLDGFKGFVGLAISVGSLGTINGDVTVNALEKKIKGETITNDDVSSSGLGSVIYNRALGNKTNAEVGEQLAGVALSFIPGGGTVSKGVGAVEKVAAPVLEESVEGVAKKIAKSAAEEVAMATAKKTETTLPKSLLEALKKVGKDTPEGIAAAEKRFKEIKDATTMDIYKREIETVSTLKKDAESIAKINNAIVAKVEEEIGLSGAKAEAKGISAAASEYSSSYTKEFVTKSKAEIEMVEAIPIETRKWLVEKGIQDDFFRVYTESNRGVLKIGGKSMTQQLSDLTPDLAAWMIKNSK